MNKYALIKDLIMTTLRGGINFFENGLTTSIRAMHLQTEIFGVINENYNSFDKVGYQRKDPVVSSFAEWIGTHALSTALDDSIGRIGHSDNPLDLAIANKGYFQYQSPDGIKITRDGRFKIDKDGNLLTLENAHVLANDGTPIRLHIVPEKLEDWSLWGEIRPQDIEKALQQNDDVAMVWITNPTYEGVVSDIKSIAQVCKKYDVPLIVDEAHGCLWNFNKNLPSSSIHLGADAVVHSLHKTGGSMSQSSMLHITKGSKFDPERVERTLQLLQTTSPSMLLMASLDAARANLESKRGKRQLSRAIQYAKFIRKKLQKIEGVNVLEATENFNQDITKVFISVDGLSGKRLESILEIDFDIEVESASDVGVLLLINIGNTKQEIQYLVNSIEKIAKSNYSDIYYIEKRKHMPMLTPKIIMNPREAYYSEKETIPKEKAIGRISAEVIAECPPGISILLPGELITEEHMPYLNEYKCIEVIKNN